ncbi:MAG: Cof-type HAD-IIB family hydrolase [Bacillota bacterium]
MENKYKLLAVDLDDTLLNRQLEVSPGNREALRQAGEAGVKVILATGRMYRAALPYARQLDIAGPLITYMGALVRHAGTGQTLFHRPAPLDLALEIIGRVKKYGYHINVYLDDELFVARHTPEGERYAALSGVRPKVVGDLAAFLRGRGEDPTKVLVIEQESLLDSLAEEMRPVFGHLLHITKSKPYFLEFSHPLANKGHALEAVVRGCGLEREQVIAVGDAYNDLEMIDYAGLGVAVANAREEIRARADFVTLSNEEDGVAAVIHKFILGVDGCGML